MRRQSLRMRTSSWVDPPVGLLCSWFECPLVALAEELLRVAENQSLDLVGREAPAFQFENEFGDAERVGRAPVAGAVDEQSLYAVLFDHDGGALDADLGDRVH